MRAVVAECKASGRERRAHLGAAKEMRAVAMGWVVAAAWVWVTAVAETVMVPEVAEAWGKVGRTGVAGSGVTEVTVAWAAARAEQEAAASREATVVVAGGSGEGAERVGG